VGLTILVSGFIQVKLLQTCQSVGCNFHFADRFESATVGTGVESQLRILEKNNTCEVSNLDRFADTPRSSLIRLVVACTILFFFLFAADAMAFEIYQAQNSAKMVAET